MSWIECHQRSGQLTAEAEMAVRCGERNRSITLYTQAAEAEVQELSELDPGKIRTLGVTTVSAVSLWYKAQNYKQAKAVARHWLATGRLPKFATEQLKTLLQLMSSNDEAR